MSEQTEAERLADWLDAAEPDDLLNSPNELDAIQYNLRLLAAESKELRKELDITEKLLADRERVLRAIPECTAHGAGCVPYALEWIDRAIAKQK